MGQSSTKPEVLPQPSISSSTANSFRPKKHLSRVELVSLQHTFKDLKSTFKDDFECIEAKQFLARSYPACTVAGPVPLSFNAFITAFVLLTGRLDEPSHPLSEKMLFKSLSILPTPESTPPSPPLVSNEELNQDTVKSTSSKGLSLAELGVDFNDLDLDVKDTDDSKASDKILSRDLVEILVLLLWLGETDKQNSHDFATFSKIANGIVSTMQTSKDEPCVTYKSFCHWKDRFAPHWLKPIQSMVIRSFGYYDPIPTSKQPRLLPEDTVPSPDTTDILSPLHTTLLSWPIAEPILITKQWTRLYSADKDGFSMNRFESHVFKYPGPTLLVIQANAPDRNLLIGAYIAQPWKHSKQFWGNDQCFLFELEPDLDVYRPVINRRTKEAQNDHFIYYHHEFGIGLGATTRTTKHDFVIHLDNTLQKGGYQHEAYPPLPSFMSAIKSQKQVEFSYLFETDNIEVFGLGNEKDRERQAREWKFERQEADRRAHLNIRQADGDLDKELLKMAGIIDEDNRQDR
ncbi:Restriction of telomere capping protein 5 [Choanephora cucurbitarum]|uniref:Restriction of telomere capping protein 5 n=1 Tax=Choanephora cucurbitarum TaxID=101091 RepID=A0A1C7N9P6_9FUNG|nr:Restriction of telomere capping protein 5 [Choanephora cucurbitarum]